MRISGWSADVCSSALALAGLVVEGPLVARERAIKRPHPVGIGQGEILVPAQFLDQVDRVGMEGEGLGLEPFVPRQRVVALAVVADVERRLPLRSGAVGQGREPSTALGDQTSGL